MDLHIGHLAATRQTWRGKTVRELLAEIIGTNKRADETTIRREFRERIKEDEDYFLAVADYAFDAAWRALTSQRTAPTAEDRAIKAEQVATQAKEHARQVASIKDQILLLNLEMPNGKRMRYCTGAEMAEFGKAYAKIAKRVGSTKLVGSVLSEADVRKLLH